MRKAFIIFFLPLVCFAEDIGRVQITSFKTGQTRVLNNIFTQIDDLFDTNDFDAITTDWVQLDTSFTDGFVEGRLQWNNEDGTAEYGLPGGNVNLQIGQELVIKTVNKTGSTISNGVPVYISGAQGSRPTIAPADADDPAKHHAVGVATEDIANNGSGYVTTFGLVRDVDTSAFTAGDELYLATTAGGFTNATPSYPAEPVHIGTVLFANAESGIISVIPHIETTFENIDAVYGATGTNVPASADYVGKLRYYTTASNSYVDVCMETNSGQYGWINIQSYGW